MEDFLVVLVDDGGHVLCAAATNFPVVLIEPTDFTATSNILLNPMVYHYRSSTI